MSELSTLAEFLKTDLPEFSPRPYFERKTDSLIFYMRDVRSKGIRLNSMLTLFVDVVDETLAGVEITEITRLLNIARKFGVMVIDHKIKLGAFLVFALAEEPEDHSIENRYLDELARLGQREIDCTLLQSAGLLNEGER